MAVITPLVAISLSTAEVNSVQGATGSADPLGIIGGAVHELQLISQKLQRIASLLPTGANKTALNAIVSTLT